VTGGSSSETAFSCSAPARQLPWVLPAALILGAGILAARIDPAGRVPNSAVMKALLVAAGAVLGLRVALSLIELRLRVRCRENDILFELRGKTASLARDEIALAEWDPPFRHYGTWPPALVLLDRRAQRYRIPALFTGGDRLVEDLVARSPRHDLADWAEAQRLGPRMGRARCWTAAGYVAAACVVAGAALAPLG
jgi:hypothetical protein